MVHAETLEDTHDLTAAAIIILLLLFAFAIGWFIESKDKK